MATLYQKIWADLWWIKSAKQTATRKARIVETVRLAQHNVRANHPDTTSTSRSSSVEIW